MESKASKKLTIYMRRGHNITQNNPNDFYPREEDNMTMNDKVSSWSARNPAEVRVYNALRWSGLHRDVTWQQMINWLNKIASDPTIDSEVIVWYPQYTEGTKLHAKFAPYYEDNLYLLNDNIRNMGSRSLEIIKEQITYRRNNTNKEQ